MSNTINPVDQGMHGRIGDKIGESTTTRKLEVATPVDRKKAQSKAVKIWPHRSWRALQRQPTLEDLRAR